MSLIAKTLEWHRAVREASPIQLTLVQRIELARELIKEETKELDDELAAISELLIDNVCDDADVSELKCLRANAAKEATDVFFVVLQAMDALDIPFEAVYAAVIENNWSKLKDGPKFRDDGKLLKPDGYVKPELGAFL
jgi:predicted HAD superfamily Cof-like phosphohydrolase